MRVYVCLVGILLSAIAMAQTGMQGSTMPASGAPVVVQPMVVPAPYAGGIIVQGGYATTGPIGPPLVTPPSVAYTPNAAVVSNTPTVIAEPSAITAAATAAATAGSVAPAANAGPGQSRGFDWGAAKMMSNSPYRVSATALDRSLGEIARENRAHPQHATRTYTNDDIARLNQQTGANNAPGANMPASDQGSTGGVLPPGLAAPGAPASTNPQAQPQQQPQPKPKPSPFAGPK